ncbi:MAG: ATP-binding protein, partial [Bacteroidetes bacterium]|nr:ATP-binding protein [Bacteroidota bacterium]
MKTLETIFLFILLLGVLSLQAQKLEKVWETTTELKTPESVLYDDERDVIYVANVNGNPAEKDGNGFISILDADGNITNLKWITNLNAPKGMAIYKNKLYVSDITQLVEIDIEKGEIIKKYDAVNSVFLNDVSADNSGMIFVSDTRTARIHVLKNGELKVWIEGKPLENPNGLMVENGMLFIG